MTDSSTWVAAKKDLPNLQILFRRDPFLINTYPTLCQSSGTTPGQTYADTFIDVVSSEKGQNIIAT
jgi:tungstate transport system substrate-binding protein